MQGEALSYASHRQFRDLIDIFLGTGEITLVLGAGMSIDAGLPTWGGLIDRLTDSLGASNALRRLIKIEEPDPKRHAGMILDANKTLLPHASLITEALYKTAKAPGLLLLSVARLTIDLGKRVKVITMNYDDRLEDAILRCGRLGTEVKPFGLRETSAWRNYDGIGILHIHGFLPSRHHETKWREKTPLILSEGAYIEHGAKVQKIIRQQAEQSHLVFVGASLSDGNVSHPLSESYSKSPILQSFALQVPEASSAFRVSQAMGPEESIDPAALSSEYFGMRQRYIQNSFRTKVVQLKSFSQVAQCIEEARVALANPGSYMSDDEHSSSRYGFRYRRILEHIHRQFQVGNGEIAAGGPYATYVSDTLHTELMSSNGPVPYLQHTYDSGWAVELRSKGIVRNPLEDEMFAMHLWLRVLKPKGRVSPYEVFAVGSSAFARRDGRALSQRSMISDQSIYAAARCMYSGRAELWSRETEPDSTPGAMQDRPWKSYLAFPLTVSESDLDLPATSSTAVMVGAITLQSSRPIQPSIDLDSYNRDQHSFISLLRPDQRQELADRVTLGGKNVLQVICAN